MNNQTTKWWRDSAAEFGTWMMDSTLRGESDWEKVLAHGRNELACTLARTGMRHGPDLSVLEVGCGLGRITFALAEKFGYALGIDVSPAFIEQARQHNHFPNVAFEIGDGLHIRPQLDRAWDVALSSGVFYLLPPDVVTSYIRDIYGLLRPGGQFIFQTLSEPIGLRTRLGWFARRCLSAVGVREWRGWPTATGFRRVNHTVEFLRGVLVQAGFRIDRVIDQNPRDSWFVASRP